MSGPVKSAALTLGAPDKRLKITESDCLYR